MGVYWGCRGFAGFGGCRPGFRIWGLQTHGSEVRDSMLKMGMSLDVAFLGL